MQSVSPFWSVNEAWMPYSKKHDLAFGDADSSLGGALTATLNDGSVVVTRGPLRAAEKLVVQPYLLVQDIEASVAAAADSGAEIAMPPTVITGHGQFAIVVQGGIESGLWQSCFSSKDHTDVYPCVNLVCGFLTCV